MIPPLNPDSATREQVLLDYLQRASGSVEAAQKLYSGNPDTGTPGMSEDARKQTYQLVRKAAIDGVIDTYIADPQQLVGKRIVIVSGSVTGNVRFRLAKEGEEPKPGDWTISRVETGELVIVPAAIEIRVNPANVAPEV